MADKQVNVEQNDAADVVAKAKGFWAAYSKKIIIAGSLVIVLLGGFIGYKKLISEPKEREANDLIFSAEKLFGAIAGSSTYNKDTVNMVLNQFDKAISHLKEFNANGASQIQSKAYILIGHAYAEQKKTDDALDYYKKAGSISDLDEAMATEAIYMAARYAEALGKSKEAIELFQELKDKYPASQRVSSGEVDKYLASLGVTK